MDLVRDPARLGGILPVLYTYFEEGGAVRPGAFAAQTDYSMEAGAAGIVLFGFVTQFYRLTFAEKESILRETTEALAGRGPLGVTVMDATTQGQVALVRTAEAAGANFLILQPPLGPSGCAPLWPAMIEEVARATALPVVIQNAEVAGTMLCADMLMRLSDAVPNLVGVKAETGSAEVAAFSREYGHRFRILTGDWGIEYPFFLENGAHGLIPAPNFVPEQVAIHEAMASASPDLVRAVATHARIVPLMQFVRERATVEQQVLLGKRALSRRIGLTSCGGRVPGPRALDPAIEAHADGLADLLWRA